MIWIVSLLAVQVIGSDVQSDGEALGFWMAGHNVYGASVIVCNLVILHRFNNFTGYGEFMVFLMILAYFLAMIILSYTGMSAALNHVFPTMFSTPTIWASLICVTLATSAGELAYRAWRKLI
jgi:hypothetical protein